MAKDPAFLFYPGDYLRDTQTLSEKSQVAYDRIMCEHMRNICISKQQLKFFTKRLSPDEYDELMFVLTETQEGFQIEWVAESISKRKEYSESRRKNRQSKNKKDMNNICKTYVKHMENENENENENKDINIYYLKSEKNLKNLLKYFTEPPRNFKITYDKLQQEAEQFILKKEVETDTMKNYAEYASHFLNLIAKKFEKKAKSSKSINDAWD